MSPLHAAAIYCIAAATIACVLIRPRELPEAVWASAGAVALVLCGLLSMHDAWKAATKARDVCLFLSGMMLLSELARREGVFDWCAALAVNRARHSPARLFWLIYGVGVVVTVFLSNDATAVVMTPAVLAAARAAKVKTPLPYLLACALVANAASFVLPISNPANLVLFAGRMPALREWMGLFALPSVLAIAATGGVLFWMTRRDLKGDVEEPGPAARLSDTGRLALGGVGLAAVALIAASALGKELGAPALAVAAIALGMAAVKDRQVLWQVPRDVSWSVLPMVVGLFIVVEAAENAGALETCVRGLALFGEWGAWGNFAGAGAVTLASNLCNNLPSGLLTGTALAQMQAPPGLRDALLIGVDLGPNLSVTGSLATVLWLIALRREGEKVTAWSFLKVGMVAMPAALVPAVVVSTLQHWI